ncbi:hypothetical protein Sme01_60550 [Sphaerisporangium melleum]|uniref:DUF5667 domain-containing protein n=1 Tax=Sphaerisporangium melleum TaxID=321316 RepID=A0A917RCC8_9ACTN|nr:DUF5667 domain-containing protein [Sphaerisporangium melleum]GGK99328.1 hypothetical protein GCM10007964_46740 [Sphaerisporangium melleum]GII73579.1 hypothetical protein Sme01_60550 [Sphaerisporangium melleum]
MGKWGPTRWPLRRSSAVGREPSHPELTARLRAIGTEPAHGPRPDFRARLREELLAAHATAAEPETAPDTGRRRRRLVPPRLRSSVVAVALTGVLVVTGLQTYAAVPGDPFYPIKRAAEATMLSMTTDDVQRAERELTAAHSRATEAAALLGYPGSRRERLIGPTLDEMTSTTRSALTALGHVKREGKHAPAIKRFTEEQRDVVEPMIPQLGGDDRMKASAYLDMIDDLAP